LLSWELSPPVICLLVEILHQWARRALKKASLRKAQPCGAFYFSQHKCAIVARQIVGSLRTRSLALRGQKNVRIERIWRARRLSADRFEAEYHHADDSPLPHRAP
jgi:hypothetical protein